jgi:hypothetical protein
VKLCAKLALWAQAVQIARLTLRQDLLAIAKNVLMTAQRNCCLGNNLLRANPIFDCQRMEAGSVVALLLVRKALNQRLSYLPMDE